MVRKDPPEKRRTHVFSSAFGARKPPTPIFSRRPIPVTTTPRACLTGRNRRRINHSFPFFTTGNAPNLNDPNNPEYGTNGINNKTILTLAGDQVWVYYGCFLNVYDPANVINGQPVQTLLNGTHHCLVAQIAYDGAPIVNANGVTESPENSDTRNAICRSRLRTIQGRRRPTSFRKHSICGRVSRPFWARTCCCDIPTS